MGTSDGKMMVAFHMHIYLHTFPHFHYKSPRRDVRGRLCGWGVGTLISKLVTWEEILSGC